VALENAIFKEPMAVQSPEGRLILGLAGRLICLSFSPSTVDLDLVELIPIFTEEAGSLARSVLAFPY
jgi:hypothetical protein